MKKFLKLAKKILIIVLIMFTINNFFISNISFAINEDPLGDFLTTALGTVVGILTWPLRMIALAAAWGVDTLTAGVAYSQGKIDESGNIVPDTEFFNSITPFDIIFNKIAIVDIDFFNIPADDTIIAQIRTTIAAWFYVMRNVAAAILLVVLIYVGIRMAISTIATDKAMYKKMLVDWISSLALIFLIQYIMIFTMAINTAFIHALSELDDGQFSDVLHNIKSTAMGVSIDAIAATAVYCLVVIQTLGMLISYINRMLKIAFLTIIAPLITLTYSIDKMGDGKAQALGTWLKEYIFTILLQPFHCVIYMAFISMAFSILENPTDTNNNLAAAILAVLCMKFTKEGEKLLGKIFRFSEHTSDSSLAVGMAASAAALGQAKNLGRSARSSVNGVKNMAVKAKDFSHNAKVELAAAKIYHDSKKNNEENKSKNKLKQEALAAAEEQVAIKEAEKEQEKADKKVQKYKNKTGENLTDMYGDKAVEKEIAKNPNAYAGMSEKEAKAKAKAKLAKQTAAGIRAQERHPISHAVGTVKELKRDLSQSKTLSAVKDLATGTVSSGLGFAVGAATLNSQNIFTATAAGLAMKKGTQEFFSTSVNNISTDAVAAMDGLNVKSKEEATQTLQTVNSMAPTLEDNQQLQATIDDLLRTFDEILNGIGIDADSKEGRQVRTAIKNTIASEVKKNPNVETKDLMKKIQSNALLENMKGTQTDSQGNTSQVSVASAIRDNSDQVRDSVGDVADMNRYKIIYDSMKQAASLGLEPTAYIDSIARKYPSGGSDENSSPSATVQAISDMTQASVNGTSDISDDRLQEIAHHSQVDNDIINDAMDTEIEESRQMVTDGEATLNRLENEVKSELDQSIHADFERKMSDLASATAATVDAAKVEIDNMIKTKLEAAKAEFERQQLMMQVGGNSGYVPQQVVTDFQNASAEYERLKSFSDALDQKAQGLKREAGLQATKARFNTAINNPAPQPNP